MIMMRSRTDVQLALPVEVENKIIKELIFKYSFGYNTFGHIPYIRELAAVMILLVPDLVAVLIACLPLLVEFEQ